MRDFVYESPVSGPGDGSVPDVFTARSDRTALLAGGTDLIPLLTSDLLDVDRVVDLKQWPGARGIARVEDGWRLGALTTLSEIEEHGLGPGAGALHDAVSSAATRQIRNRATIGGNLLQRPRCSYFRNVAVSCHMNGGDGCPARDGRHDHHAIFETDHPCIAVQPSDPATALVALGARVTVMGPDGEDRTMPVSDLLAPATADRRSLHTLGPGEVISAVSVPRGLGRRSRYRKAMDRKAWAFALVGVAVALAFEEGHSDPAPLDRPIGEIRIVAGGVANRPMRLEAAEDALRGVPLDPSSIRASCAAAAEGATPLLDNGYKVPLLRGILQRTLEDLLDGHRHREG